MPMILALRKLRQEAEELRASLEFEASLGKMRPGHENNERAIETVHLSPDSYLSLLWIVYLQESPVKQHRGEGSSEANGRQPAIFLPTAESGFSFL